MSKESAQTIQYILSKKNIKKAVFCRVTGVSRASLYKYLQGSPIHPLKARMISENIKKKYQLVVPIEKLID